MKATYKDPRTKKLKARNELERREKYIDMLHGMFPDSKHSLVVLIKACLEYEPTNRPTARQALERLGKVGVGVRDPYAGLNMLQLQRTLTEKDALIQQVTVSDVFYRYLHVY